MHCTSTWILHPFTGLTMSWNHLSHDYSATPMAFMDRCTTFCLTLWLLLQSGQWKQAVAAYNAALPFIGDAGPHPELPIIHDGDVIRANSQLLAGRAGAGRSLGD